MINSSGNVVRRAKILSSETIVDVSELANGIYSIRISGVDERLRFMKK